MLKGGGNEELINLDNLDDSVAGFLSNSHEPINFIEHCEKEYLKIDLSNQTQTNDTILNEEIDTQNLPASPPFTKVSAIKMFSTPAKKPMTPLRPRPKKEEINDFKAKANVVSKENNTVILARKDYTKSFLPKIKKRQK